MGKLSGLRLSRNAWIRHAQLPRMQQEEKQQLHGSVDAGTAAVPEVDSKPTEQQNAGDSPNLEDLKRQLSEKCAQEERLRQERQAMEARIAELQHEAEERVKMRLAEAVASSEAEAA